MKSTIYPSPQVVWNGTDWIEYEIKTINETAVTLRTPTCTYVLTDNSCVLLHPNISKLHTGGMEWAVEQWSEVLDEWIPKSIEATKIGCNSTHIWQTSIFTDGGNRTLYIDRYNKQTVIFTSGKNATYRIAWYVVGINATDATYGDGELMENVDLSNTTMRTHLNFNFTSVSFWNRDTFSLLMMWRDVDVAYYRELTLNSTGSGSTRIKITYGEWTLNVNNEITLDPWVSTFLSEGALDGFIVSTWGLPWFLDTAQGLIVGQWFNVVLYDVYRGYISFDTSSIPDVANVLNATLRLKIWEDHAVTDFIIRIMGGTQPIYGPSLELDDWGCGTVEVATWNTSYSLGNNGTINMAIPPSQINTQGRTQFELRSSREGVLPFPFVDEYIRFYGGEHSRNEPQFEISYEVPSVNITGYEWYYWNASSDRVAIVLFGGGAWLGHICYVWTYPLYHSLEYSLAKELFIQGLYEKGIDVLSVKYDTHLNHNYFVYTGPDDAEPDNTWLYDAATWLAGHGYDYIYLFGFSAGGIVVAYEIQKDYTASSYSAAVIASAPVNYTEYYDKYDLFRSAQNASKVKICTSFIAGENDMQLGNITEQMRLYYDNMVVHKEWHTWTDGHDIFPNTCKDPPNETVFDVAYNWYQHTHTLTISAGSGGTTEPAPGTYTYSCGEPVTVTASAYSGYAFDHWSLDGATVYDNPINVTMNFDYDLTAYFLELVNLVVQVPQAPPEGVNVWVDGDAYTSPVDIMVEVGEHRIEVQKIFLKEGGMPGTYYIYSFDHWSDGLTDNPRIIYLTSDTTLTAYYVRSKIGIRSIE